ncbi:unnamed protein product [Pocillopora meandrina]|uniref:Replication factor A C-terminal domain-containing protein n=1 Tax=Pocillopora meandrina TaxID=46732 RepID=A0AAU9WZP1_9CNID|nr:unnamed protein product [Pocillopora meandrina]
MNNLTGYIHNVSPVKHSNKTRYFDMLIQTEATKVRGVCFSSSKHLDFERCSKQKSSVKISNFTIKSDSVLMNARVQIEELKEVTFLREEIPSTLNISMLSNVLGVQNFMCYRQCCKCNKKLPATPGNVVKCETCGLRQKVSACSSQYHLQALLRHDDINTTVTFF